jgi:hypothetical protein
MLTGSQDMLTYSKGILTGPYNMLTSTQGIGMLPRHTKVCLDIATVYLDILRCSIDTIGDYYDMVTSSQYMFICSKDMVTGPPDIVNAS